MATIQEQIAILESRDDASNEQIQYFLTYLREKLLTPDEQAIKELQRRLASVREQIPQIREAIRIESARWNSYAPVPDESICANYYLNGLYSDLRFKLNAIESYIDDIDDAQERFIDGLCDSTEG